jgi:two-component system, sensor histidine kinase PdtaS
MIFEKRFSSVRGRLLSLVAMIVVPIAIVCIALALTNYKSTIDGINTAQLRTSTEFAVRTRLWFRGVLRSAETAIATMPALDGDRLPCAGFAVSVLRTSASFAFVHLEQAPAPPCFAMRDANAVAEDFAGIVQNQRDLQALQPWGPSGIGEFRYDVVTINGKHLGVVNLRRVPGQPESKRATILFSLEQLDPVFDIGKMDSSTIVALIRRNGPVLVSRGAEESDESWLPASWPDAKDIDHWTALSRQGQQGRYSRTLVVEPDLYLLSRFDGGPEFSAKMQLAFLAGAPLLMLALLVLSYWQFVDRNFVQSIDGIEAAALAEAAGDGAARALVIPGMPDEILRVAQAFNRMADAASSREASLRTSLDANRALMRELHHRVKNSLQVIQSYLAITRRAQPGKSGDILRDAEAKVQVLAIAYRYALTEAGLQPVPVRQFVDELIANLADVSQRSNQWISGQIDTDARLDVDRVIPLGLAIVEFVFSCLRSRKCDKVDVAIRQTSRSDFRLAISMNGDPKSLVLSDRTLGGLRLQLGAIADEPQDSEQLRWSIATA